jgi:AhpD family alkylhydroperoxidase
MQARIDIAKLSHEPINALRSVEAYLAGCGVEHSILHLVKMRASQINGCAYCLDMHSKDARARGETEQRLYALNAWHETPFYSPRERAALAWTESVTRVAETHAPDEVFQAAREHFSEAELGNLTIAIAMINTWNRLAIGLRAVPGSYEARKRMEAATAAE